MGNVLAVSQSLQSLVLGGGGGTEDGYLALVTALGANQTLESLHFPRSSAVTDECALLLAQIVRRPGRRCALRDLHVPNTGITGRGALGLAATPLLNLDLRGCKLKGETIGMMMDQSPFLPNLVFYTSQIDMKTAMLIGETIRRLSILVYYEYDAIVQLMDSSAPENSSEAVHGIVSGCVVNYGQDGAKQQLADLLRRNAGAWDMLDTAAIRRTRIMSVFSFRR